MMKFLPLKSDHETERYLNYAVIVQNAEDTKIKVSRI